MITITGASGFLGRHLIKAFEGKKVCLGHSEKKIEEARDENEWHIGDVTDKDFTDRYIKGDLVIHTAAQKVIPIAEQDPEFSIKNNILGTLNVFQSAIQNKVKTVVFISTDKAYEPETIYGKTKEVGEWMCKYFNKKQNETTFLWCRYGNVLASSMSVFEVWDKLGKEGKDIKVTVPEMTRFFFTIDDAVEAVKETIKKNDKEWPYIPQMKAITMQVASDIFKEHYNVGVEIIGNRGNEKIHEAMSDDYKSDTCERFTKEEFKKLLQSIGLL